MSGMIRYPWETPPAPGEATEVAPGILWMRLPLPMALDHVNVYALDDEGGGGDGGGDGGGGWTILDTGFDNPDSRQIWQTLMAGPLRGRPVRRVIVSHHHPDHIGLAGWFQSMGAELLIPRTGWLYARMLCLDVHGAPVPEQIAFWRAAGMPADLIARRQSERPFNFSDVVAPLPLGFTRLIEGQSLRIAGRNWQVRMGNGHAPEHATFWSDDGLILGGDQLLPSISANIGVYPTEPDADPLGEWLQSCARFAPFARDDQLVLPGHKLPFSGLPLRLHQMIENHQGALARLLDHLTEPRTAAGCFLPLFKREITGGAYGLALVEAVAHLNHLLADGRICRSMDANGAWQWQRAQVGGKGAEHHEDQNPAPRPYARQG